MKEVNTTIGQDPQILVLMGVSGCGKTTVAALLAGRLGWEYEEGDGLHPAENVAKMHEGHPLNDEDRWPWLNKVADWIDEQLDASLSGVITCSSLKRSYRDILNRRGSGVTFVYLAGTYEEIADRLAARQGHFMPPALLKSQFADLQEPAADEPSIKVGIGPAPQEIAQSIIDELHLRNLNSTDRT